LDGKPAPLADRQSSATAFTDSSGSYSFNNVSEGSYVLIPSKAGYGFEPPRIDLKIDGSNISGASFVASAIVLAGTVSGFVSTGVTITLSGATSGVTTTDASGNYRFGPLTDGEYTLTPTAEHAVFTPLNISVSVSSASSTANDFVARGSYIISGHVGGAICGGVEMTLSGAASMTTQTADRAGRLGNYIFEGLEEGSYTLTPSLAGFQFSPPSMDVLVSNYDQIGKDFRSISNKAHSISGTAVECRYLWDQLHL
jgi:hypothetical protein